MPIKVLISTAPNITPFGSVDLTGRAEVREGNPSDRDIEIRNWYGHITRTRKTIQRRLHYALDGVTGDDVRQIREWKHNRILLRPWANYNQHTRLYHCFQRANPFSTTDIGLQIGEDAPPTFDDTVISGAAKWSYIDNDGLVHVVDNDIPRYESGAYGLKGIIVDSRSYQYLIPSHPKSADAIWIVQAGTPTISTVSSVKGVVVGETHVTKVIGAVSDVVRTVNQNAGGPAANPAQHSYQIWVRGSGTIKIDMYRTTEADVIATTGNQVLDGTWQRFRLENFSKAATSAYQIRINFVTAGIIYLGPHHLNDRISIETYIDVAAGGAWSQLDSTQVHFPTPRLPELEATVHCLTQVPRDEMGLQNAWLFRKTAGSGYWGLRYRGSTNTFTFHIKTDPASTVSYVTSLNPGDPVLISAAYDSADTRIFENGVKKATTVAPGVPFALADGLYLGGEEADFTSFDEPLSFLRIDEQKQSDTEVAEVADLWADSDQRPWTRLTEGRDFFITQLQLRMKSGNPDLWRGSMTLTEDRSNLESTIEESY